MDKTKIKASILALSFCALFYLVITVALSQLTRHFSDASADAVMLTVSLPALTASVGILLVPLLAKRISLKKISLSGLLLTLAGGVTCFIFKDSLAIQIASAAVMGVAYGIISPSYPLLINKYFSGEEKSNLMGAAIASLQAGRVITVLLGGFLARLGYRYVYFTFVFAVIAVIIVCLWLPEDKPEKAGRRPDAPKTRGIDGGIIILALCGALFTTVNYTASTNGSLYIEGYGLGNSVTTGILTCTGSAAAIVTALFFGKLHKRIGKNAAFIAFAVTGACYLLCGIWVSLPSAAAAVIGATVISAYFNPYILLSASETAKRGAEELSTSFVILFMNIGYFISVYATTGLSRLMGNASQAGVFIASGALSAALAIGAAAVRLKNRK